MTKSNIQLNRFIQRKMKGFFALFIIALLATACSDSGISPNASKNNKTNQPHIASNFGLVAVNINVDRSGNVTATAKPAKLQAGPKKVASSISGPSGGTNHGTAAGTIQIKPVSVQSFNSGAFGSSNGKRYILATFAVRNADENGNVYTNPIGNMTFIAAHTGSSIGETAVWDIQKFDGSSIANPTSFANQIIPSGQVTMNRLNQLIPVGTDVMQVFDESTVAGITTDPGVSLFPYGFTVLNKNNGTRNLPASPAANQYDGVFVIAFSMPLPSSFQALRDAPYHFQFLYKPVVNTDTRITQAPEEQGEKGRQMLADHIKNDLGGISNVDKVVVFPGSRFWQYGEPKTMIKCTPTRVAGTANPLNIITALLTPNEMKQVAIYPGTAPIGGEVIVHGCDLASATVEVNSTNANIVSQDGEHVVFNVPDGLIPLTSYPVTVFRGTTPYPAGNLFTGGAIVGSGATVTSNCPESSLLGCTFKNKANMIDNNMTNYASLGGVLNLGGMYVDVTFTTQIPGGNGQHAGFLIKRGGGLLGANLLGNITVTTYNNGTPVDVATQGSNTLKLTVLSGSVSYVNVETTAPFDEIRLAITGISAGPDFQFYGAYGDYPNQ